MGGRKGGAHTKGWQNTVFSAALLIFCSDGKRVSASLEVALRGTALPDVSISMKALTN